METVAPLDRLALPYNKEVEFFNVTYDNGFVMLRMRLREGKRFTTIDLDPDTAQAWMAILSTWIPERA